VRRLRPEAGRARPPLAASLDLVGQAFQLLAQLLDLAFAVVPRSVVFAPFHQDVAQAPQFLPQLLLTLPGPQPFTLLLAPLV
jgi:hypothetical protein